jgi:hypothetical protein
LVVDQCPQQNVLILDDDEDCDYDTESESEFVNTRVNHSKKAKLNIMHVTVNFLRLFFRTGKIFFGLTRFSCLSVRMTDNFLASFGKSDRRQMTAYS